MAGNYSGATAFLSGAGSLFGAAGAASEAGASAAASEYNALLAEFNAEVTEVKTEDDIRRLKVQGRKVIGDIRASYGASGVAAEGSALDVLEESAANLTRDELNVKYQGELVAANFRNQARLNRMNADQAIKAGRYGAAAALFSGGSKVSEKM